MSRERAKAWFLLFRPWSYTATLVPFLAGGALAQGPHFSLWRWLLGLAAALPLQAACNLLNTWGDERSGVDSVPGAIRTTPQVHDGTITMRQTFLAAAACLATTFICGLPLLFYRAGGEWCVNLPLAAVAAIGFAGATNYATGVRFKYHGLGVPFVFFLMGTIEMAGVAVASAPGAGWPALARFALATLPVNCLVAVIMHGNDMRDIPTDRAAGIRTTASTLGGGGALAMYAALHLAPYACIAVMACAWRRPCLLLPFAAMPLTMRTLRTAFGVWRAAPVNTPWRGLERASGGIHAVFGVLYAIALFVAVRNG